MQHTILIIILGLFTFNFCCLAETKSRKSNDSSNPDLTKIQNLRNQGQLNQAIDLSLTHLKKYPADGDVMLVLGLIYYQMNDYKMAENYLNLVLQKTPTYLDAKIALIRVKIAEKQLSAAGILIDQVIKQDPNNANVIEIKQFYYKAKTEELAENINYYYKAKNLERAKQLSQLYLILHPHDFDIRLKLANIYLQEKNYCSSQYEFQYILNYSPNNIDAKIGLVNIALAQGNDSFALSLINNALFLNPTEKKLWIKKVNIYTTQHKYAVAAKINKKLLKCYPCDQEAQEAFKAIMDINPFLTKGVNEIGIFTINDYVSDLHSIWDYSSIYYRRDTPIGRINLQENFAKRYGVKGYEEELGFSPVFNQYFYIDMLGKYSTEPVLFPTYTLGAEPYVTIPEFLTISGGDLYAHIIKKTYFNRYTLSFSKDIKKYWLSFRPYYFVPNKGGKSLLYTATIRRYINTNDFYVNLTVGAGKSPDLSDLETLNFIIIRNRFVTAGVRFPIFNHCVLVDLGAEYLHWEYPSGLIRRLYGGNVGLSYRF